MEKNVFHGIVRGKNVELDEAPSLPDGELVTVEIYPANWSAPLASNGSAPGDGIRASAGAWADAGEVLDDWLDQLYQARHIGRRARPQ